jgi:patatin-like phospholipase/acyl hydrolase
LVKRILSIDGGGIKGVFPASFLTAIEECAGGDIAKYFDLIVGTSTGGIIALALGLGLTAKETLAFYENHGPEIFCGRRIFRRLRQWGFGKYDRKPLEDALRNVFGTKRIGDSRCRLVIPSLNAETNEVHIWKTAHHPRLQLDYKRPAIEAALATASAPTYFPTYQSVSGIPLIDGGVWANNPIAVAVVEAIGILGWSPSEIRVLSLGCTSRPIDMRWALSRFSGKLAWATKVVDVFMAAQESSSLGMAQHLVADRNQIMRISPQVGTRYELDDTSRIQVLRGLGVAEARKALPAVQEMFLESQAERFEPYHRL